MYLICCHVRFKSCTWPAGKHCNVKVTEEGRSSFNWTIFVVSVIEDGNVSQKVLCCVSSFDDRPVDSRLRGVESGLKPY